VGIWTSESVQSHCSQFIWTCLVSRETSKLPVLLGRREPWMDIEESIGLRQEGKVTRGIA